MTRNRRGHDDRIHPDAKYHGVLFTPHQRPRMQEDDFDPRKLRKQQKRKAAPRSSTPYVFGSSRRSDRAQQEAPRQAQSPRSVQPQQSAPRPVHATTRQQPVYPQQQSYQRQDQPAPRKPIRLPLRFMRNIALICAAVIAISAITIPTALAKPTSDVTINDNGRVLEASTAALTVGEFLAENKIELSPDDILESEPGDPIIEGMEIIIRRAMPIVVHSAGQTIETNMIAGTVAQVLERTGVTPAPEDEVYPAPDTYVRPGMVIEHLIVTTADKVDVRTIPYSKSEKEDSKLAKGSKEIVQYGEDGELTITTKQVYKNGVLTSEEVISEEVTKKPITEITAVGTYVAPPPKKSTSTSSIHGSSTKPNKNPGSNETIEGYNVKYSMQMQVTAYCSNCDSGSGKTASGTYASWGTIAANLSVLPFGTKVFVPGYGLGRVEDTGGFGGNVIDVYMGSQGDESVCNGWGRKNLTVYVVE